MSLDDLQAQLRAALDQQFAALKGHYENAIAEARQQARADAEHELQAKLVAARTEWEEQLAAQVEAVRAESEQAREQAVAGARRSVELELESERRRAARDLETERERAKAILEDAKKAVDGERQRARAEIDAARAQTDTDVATARGDLATARTALETAQSDAAKAHAELAKSRGELAGARQELAAAREDAARDAAAAASAKASLAARASAATGSSAASAAMYDRVATGIRTMDVTPTLGASLDALVASAGAIAGRGALFLIDGDRLKAWKSAGIPDIDVQTVESSIGGRDLLARAIQGGQPMLSGPDVPAPPFARLPPDRASLAVPVMIAGRAVAVLYVDAGPDGGSAPTEWQGAVDLLARHASALIALRTAMRTFDMLRGVPETAGDNGNGAEESARRYAKLLVSEIKLYNEGAVRVGRQQRDLRRRLQEEIDRARRLYEERVPSAVRARDTYFHQELVQTLADGDATLLEK